MFLKNEWLKFSDIEGEKQALMSVIWISFAKISKYKIRFEEFLKRKIYIEYVINLLGVVCKSVVYLMFKYLVMIYFWNILFCTLIKTIHNICMYIIITYGTLYCFSNNLYRGGHCIDNIMTLSDEMFENSMRQGNNNEELLHFSNWYYVFVYIFFLTETCFYHIQWLWKWCFTPVVLFIGRT